MSRRLLALGTLAALLVTAVWYLALFKPSTKSLSAAHSATAAALTQRTALEDQVAGLNEDSKTLHSTEAELGKVAAALPTATSLDTIIDEVNQIAIADHVTWASESQAVSAGAATTTVPASTTATTSPTTTAGSSTTATVPAATTTSGASTVSLTLTVSGDYTDVTRFLTALAQRPRLIVVDSVAFDPGTSRKVSLSIQARAFYDGSALPRPPSAERPR